VNVTKQEAVRLLAREIVGLQRNGYKLEEIVASFRGDGLDLSTATMKSYLSRVKAARSRRRGAAKQALVRRKGQRRRRRGSRHRRPSGRHLR
jgi:hypothetical protein